MKFNLTSISIPSGAIKSHGFSTPLSSTNNISIPSGAIKSEITDGRIADALAEFQFLLVRLRVCLYVDDLGNELYFNSFWCD